MTRPLLRGERVTLRPPRPEDKADRGRLGRDPEIVRMFGGDAPGEAPLTPAEIDAWYQQSAANHHGWVIEHEGRCVGNAGLLGIDRHDQRARYVVGILDPERLGRGLGTEVTRLVLAYAFDVLRLHRVELRVLSYNTRAIRCYEKCGFRQEGVERESACVDGEWHDDLRMAILEQEWRSQGDATPG